MTLCPDLMPENQMSGHRMTLLSVNFKSMHISFRSALLTVTPESGKLCRCPFSFQEE